MNSPSMSATRTGSVTAGSARRLVIATSPLRARRANPTPVNPDATTRSAKPGDHEALRRALRTARSHAGIKSDKALAIRSGVSLGTIQNWSYGKTTPRQHHLHKVALALGLRLDDLMAVYEGRDAEPVPVQDAIRELIGQLAEQTAAIRSLAAAIQAERKR